MPSLVTRLHYTQYKLRRKLYHWSDRPHEKLTFRAYALRDALWLQRARYLYEACYRNEQEPLITVTIATYNRAVILVERAVSSALNQTYRNLEVVVVGDGCTDDTGQRLSKIDDPRLRFLNLPKRGSYPPDPKHRWMVAGVYPINRAQAEAQGAWIAHLDDDAIWEPDHLEVMLYEAQQRRLELVYARGMLETSSGVWKTIGQDTSFYDRDHFFMPHSSWVSRSYLRLFRFSPHTWRLNMAVDQHTTRRMFSAGVRIGFVDRVTYREPLRPATTSSGYIAEDRS